ncbi:MAG TPA: RNA methyltransferase [Ktedonobacterales bacterium]|jgi:TrmH family RNA methyltransferase
MESFDKHALLESTPTQAGSSVAERHALSSLTFPNDLPLITQPAHPAISSIHRLRTRQVRDQTHLLYVEGIRAVVQAIKHRVPVEALVVCPKLLTHATAQKVVRQQRRISTPILEVTPEVMRLLDQIADSQGIGAVVHQQWEPLAGVRPKDELCWIALETVHSPGNLGTILRTSDAVGGAGLLLLGENVDPYEPSCVRATMGSLFAQRFVRTSVAEFVRWKQRYRVQLVGTSPAGVAEYRAVRYRAPLVLLMGDERKGLPPDLQALCDHLVRIPMVGSPDSLNVAVATGVMLYEIFHQRRKQL